MVFRFANQKFIQLIFGLYDYMVRETLEAREKFIKYRAQISLV